VRVSVRACVCVSCASIIKP